MAVDFAERRTAWGGAGGTEEGGLGAVGQGRGVRIGPLEHEKSSLKALPSVWVWVCVCGGGGGVERYLHHVTLQVGSSSKRKEQSVSLFFSGRECSSSDLSAPTNELAWPWQRKGFDEDPVGWGHGQEGVG